MKLHRLVLADARRYYKIHTFNAIVCLAMVIFASEYAWRVTFLILFVIEIFVLWMIRRDITKSGKK